MGWMCRVLPLDQLMAVMQAWTTHLDAHMPHKLISMRARPAVHSGFLKSWRANDLHLKVVKMVRSVIDSPHVDQERVTIYVTGAAPSLYSLQTSLTSKPEFPTL